MKNAILVFLMLGAGPGLVSAQEQALTVYNPWSEPLAGCARIGVAEAGLGAGSHWSVVDHQTGAPVPFQVDTVGQQKALTLLVSLDAYETRRLRVESRPAAPFAGIKLEDGAAELTVATPRYRASFDRTQGYSLKSLDYGHGRKLAFSQGCLAVSQEGEPKEYARCWFSVPTVYSQHQAQVTCEVLSSGPVLAQLRLTWDMPVGRMQDLITFNAASPLMTHEVTFDYTKEMIQAWWVLRANGFSSAAGEGLFYPDRERTPGEWQRGFCSPCPGYKFAWNPKSKLGFGILGPPEAGLGHFHYFMQGAKEGFAGAGDCTVIQLFSDCMRWRKAPGRLSFHFSLIAGADPETSARYARVMPGPMPLKVIKAAPVSAACRPKSLPLLVDRPAGIGWILSNATAQALHVPVRIAAGPREVLARPITLAANASETISVEWTPGQDDLGAQTLLLTAGETAFSWAVPVSKAVTIDRVWPRKLIHRLGEDATTRVALTSHSTREETVELVSSVTGGIDEQRVVDQRSVSLKPGETRELDIPWNTGQREYGLTFRADALIGKKLVDFGREYTAVTNFAPKVGQVGIWNPSIRQEGSEATHVRKVREAYVGIVEYYCWTPDTVNDMTPEGKSWQPHTESQGAYEVTLTKAFLQTIVRKAHENGVHVYSWITGLMPFTSGLQKPELFQYTPDGQPYLYNGRVYDGQRRYSVGPVNIYREDLCLRWGEEMARSADMFGWDGCRWDWGFVPTVPSDPLGLDEKEKDRFKTDDRPDWHDWEGRNSRELFPDPDATGEKLLKAWRKGVAKTRPEFVYGTNFNSSERTARTIPKYFQEATTDSLLLFEYLLNCSSEKMNTWEKYARHLTEDCQRVRKNRGQPCVGYMRGFLPGSTALRLVQYLIFASGVHWAANPGVRHSLDDTWERFRFALRFAEYYYDPGFFLLPEARRTEVSVQADPRVFWQPFVYERRRPTGRDITVHLLNLPKSDFIVQYHEDPPAKTGIAVRVQLRPGEKVERAAIMLPEPEPHAVPLAAPYDGSAAVVRIPSLKSAGIVLVQIAKPEVAK